MNKIIFISLLFISYKLFPVNKVELIEVNSNTLSKTAFTNNKGLNKPSPVWVNFLKRRANHKKLIASILAFPIPGGILGLHRIYLGTKPYVPVIYILTLGGGLFILPMIDFCVLLFNKDISRFENNPGVFMWVDNEKKLPGQKKE